MTKHNVPFRSTMRLSFLLVIFALFAVACQKEYDSPPLRTLPVGSVLTVAQLRALYTNADKRFTGDSSVYAVVTADEQNGNLYKNIFVQDHTGAIVMRLINSGGLYQGDSVRIYLPGTKLTSYAGMLQIDSVDVDNNVVKQATQVNKSPQLVTISQIGPELQGKLIRLENVQFVASDTALTYADAVNQNTLNRTLEDCGGATVLVRTSGYADFAGQGLPNGKGSFVGVVSQFQADMQLYIRDINEVQLTGPRCGMSSCAPASSLSETFSTVSNGTDLNIECWLNVFTQGSRKWKGVVSGPDFFAEAKPPSFGTTVNETWLVTAPMQFTPGMALRFKSALGGTYQHDGLTIMVSTNINLLNGTDVANATWTEVTAPTSPIPEARSAPGSIRGMWDLMVTFMLVRTS
ncbi:MAG: DUF5689 domain-containing protein [Flavobacteriales bacterium]